ncbi:MAG: response regulator transcription factor [Christensenellales bacterium]|nr:response regulator transcription factor [Clostridia bacterium]MDY4082919.1 response regulator transcription factor [Eubacteriales bacterium]
MRILLVEDSISLCEVLTEVLQKEKYEVQCAYDGEEGLSLAVSDIFDLIILDVMMPKKNGFDVLKELRAKKISTPVIMLTALSQESNKVQGLDLGADDYLSKPFSTSELLARIRAILRRRGDLTVENTLSYQGVVLNLSSYQLIRGTKSVKLSQKECDIMRYFMERPRYVAEKEALINKVWGFDNTFESNSLEVFISFLRKKLSFIDAPFVINSIRGVGYQLGDKQ